MYLCEGQKWDLEFEVSKREWEVLPPKTLKIKLDTTHHLFNQHNLKNIATHFPPTRLDIRVSPAAASRPLGDDGASRSGEYFVILDFLFDLPTNQPTTVSLSCYKIQSTLLPDTQQRVFRPKENPRRAQNHSFLFSE